MKGKRYSPVEVNVDDQQEGRLKKAIERKGGVTVRLTLTEPKKHTFLFTQNLQNLNARMHREVHILV